MFESLLDIAAVVSILIKFGHDDIIEDRSLFVAFLNELGITINNRKATSASLYNATQEITQKQREAIINEFNIGHEPINRKLAMALNVPKYA